MKLVRIEDKQNGIRYITIDNRYRIWKPYKKAYWELAEITGQGKKIIKYFQYFNEARQHLKDILIS